MANQIYSMDKYKQLIEKFKISYSAGKPIVTLRATEQKVTAETPEQQKKLDSLIADLTVIDVWIRTTEAPKTYAGEIKNNLGYEQTLYDQAFSVQSQKDFEAVLKSIDNLLKTKKPQEITLFDIQSAGLSVNSSASQRMSTMFDYNYGLSGKETARNMSAFVQVAEKESKENPIDEFKSTLEKYDFEIVQDAKYSTGMHVLIKDRQSGKVVFEDDKDTKKKIFSQLSFAKSWINACSADVSLAGKLNAYGYDEKAWQYAFNDGAKNTFSKIVEIFKMSNGKNLNREEILQGLSNGGGTYAYEQSIAENLFRKRKLQFATDNVISIINDHAGSMVNYIEEQIQQSSR